MTSWVAAVVRVMPHWICGVVDALGQDRERLRRLVAGLHLDRGPVDGAAIEPRRRAGLQPAERKADALERARQAERRRLADAAGRRLLLADMDQAAQERAGGQHHRAGREFAAVREPDAGDAPVRQIELVRLAFDHREIGGLADRALHGRGVELAVGLGARAAHRRTLAPVEHANWMPPWSATRPIRPSSASISRTRWPLPSPPIAGLQDMAPIVAKRWVTSAVLAPMRAAAAAASQPAWPPPMTMTSKEVMAGVVMARLLSRSSGENPEASENLEFCRTRPVSRETARARVGTARRTVSRETSRLME